MQDTLEMIKNNIACIFAVGKDIYYRYSTFIELGSIELHRCCVFYKLKARPSMSKKMTTHFTVRLALLLCSGTGPAISLRYACSGFLALKNNPLPRLPDFQVCF